jgi:hypothetical protein
MQSLRSAPHAPALVMEIAGGEGVDVAAKMTESYRLLEDAAVAVE